MHPFLPRIYPVTGIFPRRGTAVATSANRSHSHQEPNCFLSQTMQSAPIQPKSTTQHDTTQHDTAC